MRGLASILLVLVAAVAVMSIAGTYGAVKERSADTSAYALMLERAYYSKLDFKHSALQALSRGATDGKTREERAKSAANSLAMLAAYLRKNRNAELWCGVATESELELLPKLISQAKKPVKCEHCWNADERAVFVKAFPEEKAWGSYKCLSFIDVDAAEQKVGISKGGLAQTQDPELAARQFEGKFAVGISYYDDVTGTGSVAIIPEGTWVGYG